jgi:hypothetical protein
MERIYDWGGVTEERVGTILVVKGVYAGWGERESCPAIQNSVHRLENITHLRGVHT